MPSATDFLPSSMTLFMNLLRTMSPNFGSGRISRFSGRRRRDISYIPLFRPLGAVFGTALLAVLDPLRVEHAAQHMVAHAGQVANAAAADQHHAMLLEVVALAGDVADHLALVGEADLGHLPQRRVGLLRGGGIDTGADAALLRILLHRRDLGLGLLRFATLADQLVDRRHEAFTFLSYSAATRNAQRSQGGHSAPQALAHIAAVFSSKRPARQRLACQPPPAL